MNLRTISGGPRKAEAFQALNHTKQIGTVWFLFSLAQSLENNILYLPSDHWEHWWTRFQPKACSGWPAPYPGFQADAQMACWKSNKTILISILRVLFNIESKDIRWVWSHTPRESSKCSVMRLLSGLVKFLFFCFFSSYIQMTGL